MYLALGMLALATPAFAQDALLSLPLADSFANATIASFWTNERVSGGFDWEAVATAQDSPNPEPLDGDGGMLYYHAYRALKDNSARLYTAAIDAASATSPVVQFSIYHCPAGKDIVKVQISVDGGEWTDVEDGSIANGSTPTGWKSYIVPLSGAIPAGTTQFRVALTAVSAYGFNIVIDDVRIFNMAGADIAALLTPNGIMTAGLTSELSLMVQNNGALPVAAADYSIAVTAPEGIEVTLPATVDVPALGKVVLPVGVSAIDALMAHDAESYPFTAVVTMEGDEDTANNSSTADMPTGFSENPVVTGVGVEFVDGANQLSWEYSVDPTYTPQVYKDNFEGYAAGFQGPFNGWEAIDLDGRAGDSSIYNASGSGLNVGVIPEGSSWRTLVHGFDGTNMLCVTVPSGAQQDDWLISPALNGDGTHPYTLSFMLGYKNFSFGVINNFEILYTNSDAELNPSNPGQLLNTIFEDVRISIPAASSGTTDPIYMEEMVFEGIPGTAKRVAIHFKSKMTSYNPNALWLDCLCLADGNPLTIDGYNVYELGKGRVNPEILPKSVNSIAIPDAGSRADDDRLFFVTAMYNDGESAPSEIVSLNGAHSAIEAGVADADAAVEYFNLQGIRVESPAKGTPVIRKQGTKIDKVIIK